MPSGAALMRPLRAIRSGIYAVPLDGVPEDRLGDHRRPIPFTSLVPGRHDPFRQRHRSGLEFPLLLSLPPA
jgi:hypothetical protein